MKRALTIVCLLVAVDASAGQFLARFNNRVPASFANQVIAAGGTVQWTWTSAGFAVITGLSDASVVKLAAKSGADIVADPVGPVVRLGTPTFAPTEEKTAPSALLATTSAVDPTAAEAYPLQWHLRAIGADAAWAAGRLGSDRVTVAVVDTGIDYLHPDLAGRVDLSRSASFVPSDDSLVEAYFPGRHPVTDLYYHGTFVASTIASNGEHLAGVTANVTLLGVKVISAFGEGSLGSVLAGVLWATDHGADVINISLGGNFIKQAEGRSVAFVNQVFNYAHRNGAVVVVAAGNEGVDFDGDRNSFATFCSAPNVICVAATGPTSSDGIEGPWYDQDAPAWYTNHGRSAINVAAPGGTTAGYVWGACAQTVLWLIGYPDPPLVIANMGTSMAAPHVAGLAALLVEDLGRNPSRIKARIQSSADDLGEPGADPWYGRGRINVPRALGLE
jgi:subtilisin family serine protease